MNSVICETSDYAIERTGASPEQCYRSFLAAIRVRDIAQLVGSSTKQFNASLRDMMRMDDFDVMFDLWCESYSQDIRVYGCAQRGNSADLMLSMTVDGRVHFVRVSMFAERGRWKVAGESFRVSVRLR
jgi:hypothetical protein